MASISCQKFNGFVYTGSASQVHVHLKPDPDAAAAAAERSLVQIFQTNAATCDYPITSAEY